MVWVPLNSISDRVQRVGNRVVTPTGISNYKLTSFLLSTTVPQDGVLFAFSAYFMNQNPFGFQMWEEVDSSKKTFRLLKQWDIIPGVNQGHEDVRCIIIFNAGLSFLLI